MAPKRFKIDAEKGYIGESKTKYKPKPYVASRKILDYFYQRDMNWYNDIFCQQDIKEMVERRLKENFYERE